VEAEVRSFSAERAVVRAADRRPAARPAITASRQPHERRGPRSSQLLS
jgi:hypothetical protein